MNVRLNYLYRDAGNFKNWGEVIFANPQGLQVDEVSKLLTAALDGEIYFVADRVGLPDLHFEEFNYDLDHGWHEIDGVEPTDDEPTDVSQRTIDEFIATLRSAPVT